MNASPRKILENTKCKIQAPAYKISWPYWVPVLLYAAGLFYLSAQSAAEVPPPFPHYDKVIHFFLYMGFAFFVARAVAVSTARVDRFTLWLAITIAAVYGLTDEWHQYYVPTRTCDVWNWVADFLGSIAGTFLYTMYNYWALKRYVALKQRIKSHDSV